MPDESVSVRNSRLAQDIQQKFEAWLVGLVFGVLALAVNSAQVDGSPIATVAEVLAWACLLASGLAGLVRREHMPGFYYLSGHKAACEQRIQTIENAQSAGTREFIREGTTERMDPQELIATQREWIGELQGELKKVTTTSERSYTLLKWGLVAGMLLLFVARGVGPITGLFQNAPPSATAPAEAEAEAEDVPEQALEEQAEVHER